MLQKKQLNQNIKLIRELSGKKQEDFAELIKTNLSNLKTYENTNVKPKANLLAAIADYAGITVDDLREKKLNHKDLNLRKDEDEKVEKVEATEAVHNGGAQKETQQSLIEKMMNFIILLMEKQNGLVETQTVVMQRQNTILEKNQEFVIDKIETISITVEAIKINQEKLILEIRGSLNAHAGKLQVFEKTVVEKFSTLSLSGMRAVSGSINSTKKRTNATSPKKGAGAASRIDNHFSNRV